MYDNTIATVCSRNIIDNSDKAPFFAISIPRVPFLFASQNVKSFMRFLMPRGSKEAISLINDQEGFVGFFAQKYIEGEMTLCVFETKNQAKCARNVLKQQGIEVDKLMMKLSLDGDEWVVSEDE